MLMFRKCVLPHLNPCDARRLPRSVLIVDNASLHWSSPDQLNELQAEVQSVGAELLYIPQYCPRANAIEGGFSQVNKELEADIVLADRDPERALDRDSDRTARTAPDQTARTAPDSFGQQTTRQHTAKQQAQSQRLANTLRRWEGRCWAVVLNPPNNKSLN